ETKNISAGFTAEFFIPSGAVGITLIVDGIATVKGELFRVTFPKAENLEKGYKCWGTIFDAQHAEIPTRR
ncbi:MAG: hypothetical protein AB8B69_03115, partial [Chitinophagales bacterium]